jgi:hypothetical protein
MPERRGWRRFRLAHDEEASGEGTWTLAQAAGPPRLAVRWRQCDAVPDRARPVKVTVGVMFDDVRPDGMPAGQAENDFLGLVEEALFGELAERGARLVLVVTSQGAREWVAYASSADWLTGWAPAFAQRCLAPRGHDINAVLDLEWTTYRAFSR